MAREVIRHGGSALLAETPELIGAESYVLQHVKDADTARGMLSLLIVAPAVCYRDDACGPARCCAAVDLGVVCHSYLEIH